MRTRLLTGLYVILLMLFYVLCVFVVGLVAFWVVLRWRYG